LKKIAFFLICLKLFAGGMDCIFNLNYDDCRYYLKSLSKEKALMFAKRICDKQRDFYNCYSVLKYAKTEKDKEYFYDRMCDAGNPGGCYAAGNFYLDKNNTKAFKAYQQACYSYTPDYEACYMAGYLSYKTNLPKALALFEKACKHNHAQSCLALGILSTNKTEKKNYYKKACKLGIKKACGMLTR